MVQGEDEMAYIAIGDVGDPRDPSAELIWTVEGRALDDPGRERAV